MYDGSSEVTYNRFLEANKTPGAGPVFFSPTHYDANFIVGAGGPLDIDARTYLPGPNIGLNSIPPGMDGFTFLEADADLGVHGYGITTVYIPAYFYQ
jgi:hypothetical protein